MHLLIPQETTTMTDFKKPLAPALNPTPAPIVSTAATVLTTDAPKVEEKKFQHYAYSKACTQMITEEGKKFSFVAGKLITDDKEIINYLDEQIRAGLNTITKGALLSAKESDPMRAVKAAAVADYIAEQKALNKNSALGIKENMGSTDTGKSKPFSPVSTTDLTNAGKSSSGVGTTAPTGGK